MIDKPPMKRCSRGEQCAHLMGCWQPASADYFSPDKRRGDGFKSSCKACNREDQRRYRAESLEKTREHKRQWYARNKEKERGRKRQWYARNKEKVLERRRQWYTGNRKSQIEQAIEYRHSNAEKAREYDRRRYIKNATAFRERQRLYNAKNREGRRINKQRRRARQRGLPNTFTIADWQRALDYFGNCCAVCGRTPDEHVTLAADHWIALSDPRPDNPGTVAANLLPLCHGVDGCNNRKSSRDPVEFLETEFGEQAEEILVRILAYFCLVAE